MNKLLSLIAASTTMLLFFSTTTVFAFSPPHHHDSRHYRSITPIITTHQPSLLLHPMRLQATPTDTTATSTTSNSNNEMQSLGNSIILSAARAHGATDKMISIEWKADRIIVTVDVSQDDEYEGGDGSVVVGELEELEGYYYDDDQDDGDDDDDDFDMEFIDQDEEFDDDDEDFNEDEEEEEEDFEALQAQLGLQDDNDNSPASSSTQKVIDLTLIARTINEYLSADGENTPQFKIAQLHEIEVTTPEFDNVLRVNGGENGGVNMFEVYKGFDVVVDYWEVPKKKKKKKKKSGKAGKDSTTTLDDSNSSTNQPDEQEENQEQEEPTRTQTLIEGKLVGRDEDKDVTMINVKGRIVKIKNDMIESVKLPKAKREKGAK